MLELTFAVSVECLHSNFTTKDINAYLSARKTGINMKMQHTKEFDKLSREEYKCI